MQTAGLKRDLSPRQVGFMALGAAIGVGLFLGSATAIHLAGPSVLIAYVVAGGFVFLIMRALGEMAVDNPVSGSFSTYAAHHLGPYAGYLTGWNYWILNVGVGIAETTAVGIYMKLWFPDVAQWIWVLASVGMIGTINLTAVKMFGELEFWFALVKVATVMLLIAGGAAMIATGWGNYGHPIPVSNLWGHGGWFPHGVIGMIMSLPVVVYAYGGIETIGLTAGEVQRPERVIPRAINTVPLRILIFYVGALAVILTIYPWNQIGTQGSPFVMIFKHLGIREAAGFVNFVVISAALSSFNCTVFCGSRVLYGLAQQGQAPKATEALSGNGVPVRAVVISLICLLFGVLLNYLAPAAIFGWMMSLLSFAIIWTWSVVLLAHFSFRIARRKNNLPRAAFPMFAWPFSSLLAMAFLAFVIFTMASDPDGRVSLEVGASWILLLSAVYLVSGRTRLRPLPAES